MISASVIELSARGADGPRARIAIRQVLKSTGAYPGGVMTVVTIERIARLNALVRAAARDTADEPTAEQDRLLVQACADTCRLLRDWLDSDEWSARRAPRRPQYPQAAGQDYLDLLDRALGDLLDRAAQLAGVLTCPPCWSMTHGPRSAARLVAMPCGAAGVCSTRRASA